MTDTLDRTGIEITSDGIEIDRSPTLRPKKELREELHPAYEGINWNNVPDFENQIWEMLLSQFWVPAAVPVSQDVKSWSGLSDEERRLVLHVFTGLTMLDTVQGRFGAYSLKKDADSLFEEAIYDNISFMEQIHAKSYSTIFSTLASTPDVNEAFRWSANNEYLRKKTEIVMALYRSDSKDPIEQLKKKAISTLLESFLFYSGFYLPLYLDGKAQLTNTASMIRLIMRDEAVHGMYIGTKFQQGFRNLSEEQQGELQDWVYEQLLALYENETRYTQDLYDGLGLTEEVKSFLRFNANRALDNLGLDRLFPKEDINPVILRGMDLNQQAADFFSQKVVDYNMTVKEGQQMSSDDWDEMDF